MENNVIWKSWDLMSQEEKNEFLDDGDLLACYLDNYHENFDTYVKEEFEEYCQEMNNIYFDNDFGKCGNWISSLENVKIEVRGKLGLWNGTHTIYPEKFDNLYDAIQKCLEDYNEIYEDEEGNLKISAHHHDGVNNFVLMKVVNNRVEPLHFCKTVFGVGA